MVCITKTFINEMAKWLGIKQLQTSVDTMKPLVDANTKNSTANANAIKQIQQDIITSNAEIKTNAKAISIVSTDLQSTAKQVATNTTDISDLEKELEDASDLITGYSAYAAMISDVPNVEYNMSIDGKINITVPYPLTKQLVGYDYKLQMKTATMTDYQDIGEDTGDGITYTGLLSKGNIYKLMGVANETIGLSALLWGHVFETLYIAYAVYSDATPTAASLTDDVKVIIEDAATIDSVKNKCTGTATSATGLYLIVPQDCASPSAVNIMGAKYSSYTKVSKLTADSQQYKVFFYATNNSIANAESISVKFD